jgi:hypothetical protein
LIWESEPTFENPDSIAVDDKNVYVSYMRYVQTYDLRTGKKRWTGTQQSKYKKGSLFVYSKEKQIEVYDTSSNWPHDEQLFILDAQTGETTNTIEWPRIFFGTII